MLVAPFTASSIGTATFCATTSALAPTYVVVTVTVGGVMFGYCSRGSDKYDSAPTRTISKEIAIAKLGRWMKNWLSIAGGAALSRVPSPGGTPGAGGQRRGSAQDRDDLAAGPRLLQPFHDHALALLHAAENDEERSVRAAFLDGPQHDRVVGPHNEHRPRPLHFLHGVLGNEDR